MRILTLGLGSFQAVAQGGEGHGHLPVAIPRAELERAKGKTAKVRRRTEK